MRVTMRRWLVVLVILLALIGAGVYAAAPYARATSLILRAAKLGGPAEAFATQHARAVTVWPFHMVPTRQSDVRAQFYVPEGEYTRSVLLIPGIHSMGINEPRLTTLAKDLAGSGVMVMTMALPDLQRYRITPLATDVIEDVVLWMTQRSNLAPDGKIGIVGVSFSGGLSVAAASRPTIRDKLAFVVSFGGHGNLPRVMRYLATGEEPKVEGLPTLQPHDYGVAVILDGLADRGVVPAEQVRPLREGVETFLMASQLTLVDANKANATFKRARDYEKTLPEPSATYMKYVNDRSVKRLGPVLVPFLDQLGANDPALSADQATIAPTAPIYLLHGDEDTVIPAAESALLAESLRKKGANVHLLLSGLITHAEVNKAPGPTDAWKLVSFWASVLQQ